jgi:ABC-type transport system involved in multi-copper enzyme maturation permease subunit
VNAVSPALEVQLVALRELRKSLRSLKGLVLLALTVLGGGSVMYLLLRVVRSFEQDELSHVDAASVQMMRLRAIKSFLDSPDSADYLTKVPLILLLLGYLTVSFTPALVALAGFDSVSGELQHRSNRFWTVRVRKSSYLVGKWLGLWIVAAATMLPLHVAVWVMGISTGEITAAEVISWGPRVWLWWLPIAAAWSAMVVLASSLVRKPFFALVLSLLGALGLWIVSKIFLFLDHSHPGMGRLVFVDPSACVDLVGSGDAASTLVGIGIAAAFALSALGLAAILFERSDV